jgi:hypothetical protein
MFAMGNARKVFSRAVLFMSIMMAACFAKKSLAQDERTTQHAELTQPSLDEIARDLRQRQEQFIRNHRSEEEDAQFKYVWETNIGQGLGELVEQGRFSVETLECRSATCVATIAWKSFDDALRSHMDIVSRSAIACQTEIFIDPSKSTEADFKSEVLYSDCGVTPEGGR